MALSKSKTVLAISFLLILEGVSQAKEWRGIVPLQSKKEDVVRLLKQCEDAGVDCGFDVGSDHIRIIFSGDATGGFSDCSTQVAPGTVLLIEVTPKKDLQFRRLRLNRKQLRSLDPSSPPNMGYKAYLDDKRGLILNTYKGRVLKIFYIASTHHRHLCQRYYENPEAFVQVGLSGVHRIVVICPEGNPRAGERITLSAEATVDRKGKFVWSVSAGRIEKGQGTPVVTVDTTGLEGRTIVATVDFGELSAACEIRIAPK